MRNALLIAAREYAENARTKGFWIGIMMVPVMLVLVIFVTRYLAEDATPIRHYVVVDQTEHYGPEIEKRMDLRFAVKVLRDFQGWVKKNRLDAETAEVDFENMPPMDMEDFDPDAWIEKVIEDNPKQLKQLLDPGVVQDMVAVVRSQLKPDVGDFDMPRREFLQVPLPDGIDANAPIAEISEAMKPYLKGDQSLSFNGKDVDVFALLIIPADVDHSFNPKVEVEKEESDGIISMVFAAVDSILAAVDSILPPKVEAQYWSGNLADTDLYSSLSYALNRELRHSQYLLRGMDSELVGEVQKMDLPITKLDPEKEIGEEEVSQADVMRQYAPIGFVYMLWISIMTVTSMLLNNTIEEKSNRIIEVLLSSVTAWELMAGKLLGIAGIGITLLLCWIGSVAGLLWYWSSPEAELITNLASVIFDSTLLPAFIFYFLGGYFMYAGIFLAIGSICNTIKEAQNFMGPVMMIMMVPLLTMMFIPKDPHGTLATILSWIPIYTPFVMMNRAAADPPAFDLYGTAILLLVSNVFVLWLCGRIFRTGILRTGQPPRIMEMLRWIRRSND
jgi:ABC-2 type transport system permease protein